MERKITNPNCESKKLLTKTVRKIMEDQKAGKMREKNMERKKQIIKTKSGRNNMETSRGGGVKNCGEYKCSVRERNWRIGNL